MKINKLRIRYLERRKPFSTGLFVNPNNWNSKQQLVKPPEANSDYINNQLNLIKAKINRAFLMPSSTLLKIMAI